MKEDLKELEDAFDRVRAGGLDPFGFASDPEASLELANVARNRFVQERSLWAFQEWSALVREIRDLHGKDPSAAKWLVNEYVRLAQAQALIKQESALSLLAIEIGAARSTLSAEEASAIAGGFEASWHSVGLTKEGVEG